MKVFNLLLLIGVLILSNHVQSAVTLVLKPEEAHLQDKIIQNFQSLRQIYVSVTAQERIHFFQILKKRSVPTMGNQKSSDSSLDEGWADQEKAFFFLNSAKINSQDNLTIQRALSHFVRFSPNVKAQLAELFNSQGARSKVKTPAPAIAPIEKPSKINKNDEGSLEIVLDKKLDLVNISGVAAVSEKKIPPTPFSPGFPGAPKGFVTPAMTITVTAPPPPPPRPKPYELDNLILQPPAPAE